MNLLAASDLAVPQGTARRGSKLLGIRGDACTIELL